MPKRDQYDETVRRYAEMVGISFEAAMDAICRCQVAMSLSIGRLRELSRKLSRMMRLQRTTYGLAFGDLGETLADGKHVDAVWCDLKSGIVRLKSGELLHCHRVDFLYYNCDCDDA